ncbi:MAG: LytTR family transcriptional regulator DNA-binding domain-containing protein [Kiritimatiellae bacterium]|nr:LytTR family transcriptional regulator DNA-binding domain-containing protein [Kiritimatiellia bacterium]
MSAVFRVGDLSPWKYFLGVSIALGILFAALRPEGTADRGHIPALLQWLAQAMIPMALCIVAHLALHRSSAFDRLNPWLKLLASGGLGAFLFSPVAYGIDLLLGDGPSPGHSHLAGWLDELGAVLVPVAFTWVAVNAPFRLGYSFRREVVAPPAAPPDPPAAPPASPSAAPFFLGLIPAALRGEPIHMKSEWHYLRVATIKGQSLILYTLRDAILELPPDMGVQTHRSYWANLAHVKEFKTRGRLATLTMSDGAAVPVSRSKVKDLKARLGRLR